MKTDGSKVRKFSCSQTNPRGWDGRRFPTFQTLFACAASELSTGIVRQRNSEQRSRIYSRSSLVLMQLLFFSRASRPDSPHGSRPRSIWRENRETVHSLALCRTLGRQCNAAMHPIIVIITFCITDWFFFSGRLSASLLRSRSGAPAARRWAQRHAAGAPDWLRRRPTIG